MRSQYKSLEKIRSQARRLSAFGNDEIQAQLQLTDKQREQVRTILRDSFQEANSIREALAALQKQTLEQAIAVLTDEQKSTWEQIQEELFEVEEETDHRMRQDEPGLHRESGIRRQRKGRPAMADGPGRRRRRSWR